MNSNFYEFITPGTIGLWNYKTFEAERNVMDPSKFGMEQLAGQRLMAGFDGTALNDDLEYLISTLKVGGLILFSRNVAEPDQIRALCTDVQAFAVSCGQPPLFIAIDQEGGQVARLQ